METINQPTGEQCNSNDKVYEDGEKVGYAIWYPSMGGYVSAAVAVFVKGYSDNDDNGGCVNMLIWHDGNFPFSEDDDRQPSKLHHCNPDQFIELGNKLMEMDKKAMEMEFKYE